jgi:hypothetical protein
MFEWFKKPGYTNVVKFPEQAKIPTPFIELPKQEKESSVHYTLGHTDDNRIAFRIGYSTLTMNRVGVEHLIQQLQVFRDQLHEEQDDY